MELTKVMLERKTGNGITNMITSIPLTQNEIELNVGDVISLDAQETKWTIVQIIKEDIHYTELGTE
jgi:hypothetical protein